MDSGTGFVSTGKDDYLFNDYPINRASSSITIVESKFILDEKFEVSPEMAMKIAERAGIPIVVPDPFVSRRFFVV